MTSMTPFLAVATTMPDAICVCAVCAMMAVFFWAASR